MIIITLIEYLRDRIKYLVKFSYAALALLIIMDAMPFIVDKNSAHLAIERIPGFWAFFGFIACALIIFVSKWIGHAGIMQNEDYYNREDN